MRKKTCDVCSKDWRTMCRVIHKKGAGWLGFRVQAMFAISQKRTLIINLGALGVANF